MLVLLLTVASLAGAPAEPCAVPARSALIEAEDYAPHEDVVVACLQRWVAEPLTEDEATQAFVLRWLTGVPYLSVRVRLDGAASAAMRKNRDAGISTWYLYGLASTALNDREADPVAVELGGLKAVIARYNATRAAGGKKHRVLAGWAELSEAELRQLAEDSVLKTE